MRTLATAGLAIAVALVLGACGSASVDPGADPTDVTVDPDDPVSDDGTPGEPSSDGLLADTTGDAPFYIGEVLVRVAESYPVQLFLDVAGDAPTPGHTVAYTVATEGDRIEVHITTQTGEGASPQVLQPHRFVIPLGHADLPVTIDVNDGEFTETVEP